VVQIIQHKRLFVYPETVLRLFSDTASRSPLLWLEEDRVTDYWKRINKK
jgi:hypothetical protein